MDKTGYFWYSAKQDEVIRSMDFCHPVNYCVVDGKILHYTEWKRDASKSNWDDAVFLGQGVYYDSETL